MMRLMTRAASAIVLSGLLATSAFAAPLPASKPAGTREATLAGSGLLWIGFATIIAVTVGVVASNNDGGVTNTTFATATP